MSTDPASATEAVSLAIGMSSFGLLAGGNWTVVCPDGGPLLGPGNEFHKTCLIVGAHLNDNLCRMADIVDWSPAMEPYRTIKQRLLRARASLVVLAAWPPCHRGLLPERHLAAVRPISIMGTRPTRVEALLRAPGSKTRYVLQRRLSPSPPSKRFISKARKQEGIS
jgi:hypothetical protein